MIYPLMELISPIKAGEGIDAIIGAAGSVDSGITRIHEELKSIEKIVKVVTDIANQTNLLAINAAIEAAHAGNYGRGFAVVASEVKLLAVQSKESTTNISRTLEALHAAFQEVKKKVSEVQNEVQSRSFAICEMVNLFKRMTQEVEKIAAMSRETGTLSGHQEKLISDLHKRVLTIGELMNETSEDANASAKACNSSFISVEQISGNIERVAKLSDQIHQGISGFTV
jgi:methyl-accepting chemotaxis protein